MRRKHTFLFFAVVLCWSAVAHAQQWSGIIDPSRAIEWSQAGIPGGIPNRTTICSTLNPGATAAQINTAIANCTSGQVVYLNAGTYNLSSGIIFNGKNSVTLRGAGADQTKLVFSGNVSCSGLGASICLIGGTENPVDNPTTVTWTAGYARGATQLTLSSVSGLSVGRILLLDQANDSNTDTGDVWICETESVCSSEGPSGAGATGRVQEQFVRVTSINGNVVTVTPGLYMPNWRSGQNPKAWHASAEITSSGVENLSMDHTNSGGDSGIILFNAYGCWVKGVRSITSNRNHVWLFMASASTIRDSYFYGTKNAASQSYGIEPYLGSDVLVENNIFQRVTAPISVNGTASGSVFAYNYAVNDYWSAYPNSLSAAAWLHSGGIDNVLFEGNDGAAWFSDEIHGSHHFVTVFRTHWVGWETGKSSQLYAVAVNSFSRYFNLIGNVLGRTGTQDHYQSSSDADASIYFIGTPSGNVPYDPLSLSSLMRWGNYDTVNAAARWQSSEVPSGISPYGNAVPGSQTLPASFYVSAKPAWWPAAKPWPAIGPDVTGGNISGVGGHVYSIPAQDCYTSVMGGPADGSGNVLGFNAASCYGSVPSAPSNLRVQ